MTYVARVRPVDAARLAIGVAGTLRPRLLIRATRSADGTWPRRLTRLLAARYFVQAVTGTAVPGRRTQEVDGAIDLVHAASTVCLAVAFPDHRRLALEGDVGVLDRQAEEALGLRPRGVGGHVGAGAVEPLEPPDQLVGLPGGIHCAGQPPVERLQRP